MISLLVTRTSRIRGSLLATVLMQAGGSGGVPHQARVAGRALPAK